MHCKYSEFCFQHTHTARTLTESIEAKITKSTPQSTQGKMIIPLQTSFSFTCLIPGLLFPLPPSHPSFTLSLSPFLSPTPPLRSLCSPPFLYSLSLPPSFTLPLYISLPPSLSLSPSPPSLSSRRLYAHDLCHGIVQA